MILNFASLLYLYLSFFFVFVLLLCICLFSLYFSFFFVFVFFLCICFLSLYLFFVFVFVFCLCICPSSSYLSFFFVFVFFSLYLSFFFFFVFVFCVFVFVYFVFVFVSRDQSNQLVTHLSPAPLIDQEFPFLITTREPPPSPSSLRHNFNPTTEEEAVSLIKGAVYISRCTLVSFDAVVPLVFLQQHMAHSWFYSWRTILP